MDKRKINGEKVEHLRQAREWSQRQLGEMVGLSQAGVNTVEKEYQSPAKEYRSTSVEKFIRLAEALDTSLDYLADRTDDPTPPAKLAQKLEIVGDTPAQKQKFKTMLDRAKLLPEDELDMVILLLMRLSGTEPIAHTSEARAAAQIIDALSDEDRADALAAVRNLESKINDNVATLSERMNYLISLVESRLGIDARAEIERDLGIRLSDSVGKQIGA